jgi:hypothetical protein
VDMDDIAVNAGVVVMKAAHEDTHVFVALTVNWGFGDMNVDVGLDV